MTIAQTYTGQERRARDRAAGIQLRRRAKKPLPDKASDRRKTQDGFDIAAALELHLDQVTTRRGMIALLESWLQEAKDSNQAEHDESYMRALMHAREVMTTAPDPLTAIAVLQRSS